MRKGCGAVVVLAVLAAGLWVSPTASAAAKPDLVVKALGVAPDADFTQIPHVVVKPDGTSEIFVQYTVKNVGRATAWNVELSVLFEAQTEMLLSLPRIRAGDRKRGWGTVELPLPTLGIHPLEFCADPLNLIAESNEANNCMVASVVRVIAERWLVVRFSATRTYGSYFPGVLEEKSQKTDFMAFTYKGIDYNGRFSEGVFRYEVDGQATQSVSGSTPTCSYSGSTDYPHYPWPMEDGYGNPAGVFDISTDLDAYFAQAWDPSDRFTYTQSCNSGHNTWTNPTSPLRTQVEWNTFRNPSMNPYSAEIDATFTDNTSGDSWVWDQRFIADI